MKEELSNEEKKKISYLRQNAVRNAWKEERNRVLEGRGTRNWNINEQKELLERGKVSGYDGHHMKSVSLYPEYAGDSRNIQFLSEYEHLYGAHRGNYHNLTNGYYDSEKQEMVEFGDELLEIPIFQLNDEKSDDYDVEIVNARFAYMQDNSLSSDDIDENAISNMREVYEFDNKEFASNIDKVEENNDENSYLIERR